MSEDAGLQRLADRMAIQDCLHRYARGIDRRHWDFLQSAFPPGAPPRRRSVGLAARI